MREERNQEEAHWFILIALSVAALAGWAILIGMVYIFYYILELI